MPSEKMRTYIVTLTTDYSNIQIYGARTLMKYLRTNGCVFSDGKIALIRNDVAQVFTTKDETKSFIVEEKA